LFAKLTLYTIINLNKSWAIYGSDHFRYPTFARTVPAESVIARSFMALLRHFCWHKFTMIFETTPANGELHNAIRRTLEDENQKHGSGQGGGSIDEQNESNLCSDEDKYQILNTSQIPHPFSEVLLLLIKCKR
jgi:hypothetical protein